MKVKEKINWEQASKKNMVMVGTVHPSNEVIRRICYECDTSCMALYIMLLSHRNTESNKCFPSMALLARELNTSSSSVKRWLKKLADKGFIIINSGERGISNTYFFPLESFYKGEGLGAVRKLWKQK